MIARFYDKTLCGGHFGISGRKNDGLSGRMPVLGVILITRTDRGGDAGRNLGGRVFQRGYGAIAGMHRRSCLEGEAENFFRNHQTRDRKQNRKRATCHLPRHRMECGQNRTRQHAGARQERATASSREGRDYRDRYFCRAADEAGQDPARGKRTQSRNAGPGPLGARNDHASGDLRKSAGSAGQHSEGLGVSSRCGDRAVRPGFGSRSRPRRFCR